MPHPPQSSSYQLEIFLERQKLFEKMIRKLNHKRLQKKMKTNNNKLKQ